MLSARKKRILYVTPFCQDISGADESLILILKGLDKSLFEPFVAVAGKTPYAARFKEHGAKIIELYFNRIKRSLNPFYLLFYAFSVFIEIFRFRRLIKEMEIDIVHTNMEVVVSSGIAAKLCGVKSVYHYRHNAYDRPKIFYDVFIRLLARISDRIFVISKAVGEAFYKRGAESKVEVLYNAIEISRFTGEKRDDFFAKNFALKKGEKAVVTVGRINKRKNLEDFLRMAGLVSAKRDDARFFIVGEAHFADEQKYKIELENMICDLGLKERVVFTGKQAPIQYVMNSSDIITISAYHEGFGRVVVEAMACAKPVIGCDSGAVPEVMDYCECGIVYPIGDSPSFSEAVIKLLEDSHEAKRLGDAGLKRVTENFTLENQRKRIEKAYADLISR